MNVVFLIAASLVGQTALGTEQTEYVRTLAPNEVRVDGVAIPMEGETFGEGKIVGMKKRKSDEALHFEGSARVVPLTRNEIDLSRYDFLVVRLDGKTYFLNGKEQTVLDDKKPFTRWEAASGGWGIYSLLYVISLVVGGAIYGNPESKSLWQKAWQTNMITSAGNFVFFCAVVEILGCRHDIFKKMFVEMPAMFVIGTCVCLYYFPRLKPGPSHYPEPTPA